MRDYWRRGASAGESQGHGDLRQLRPHSPGAPVNGCGTGGRITGLRAEPLTPHRRRAVSHRIFVLVVQRAVSRTGKNGFLKSRRPLPALGAGREGHSRVPPPPKVSTPPSRAGQFSYGRYHGEQPGQGAYLRARPASIAPARTKAKKSKRRPMVEPTSSSTATART